MRFESFKARGPGAPLNGVTFDKDDKARIAEMAGRLSRAFSRGELAMMRRALITESLALDAAYQWTSGDTEVERSELHQQSLLMLSAVDHARSAQPFG